MNRIFGKTDRGTSDGVRGFTVVELLVVVGILALLLAFLTPAVTSLFRASNLSRASSMVADELNRVRQLALTKNRDVEIRFYKLGSKSDPNDRQFRAFRSLVVTGTQTTALPLTGVKHFPEPAIISSDARFSTLIDGSREALLQGTETLPSNTSASYVSFLIRATGGTNLVPVTGSGSNWYLTFLLSNAAQSPGTGLPDNYATLQIDPVTGRVRVHRP